MSELAYENCYGVINNHIIGKSTVDNRNLALVYDPDSVYNKGDHCIHEMKYWVCNTNNTTGAWNATKWTQARVGDELTDITKSDTGTPVTLDSYTSSNRFVAPSDGYVKWGAGTTTSSLIIGTNCTLTAGNVYNGITVRKGSRIYAALGTNGHAYYYPMT